MVDSVGKPLAALRRRRRIALVGLGLVLAISLGTSIVVELASADRHERVVHDAADRMSEAEALVIALEARSTAARGYLLSGSPQMLEERSRARETAQVHLANMAQRDPDSTKLLGLKTAITQHDMASNRVMTMRTTAAAEAIAEWDRDVRPLHQEVMQRALSVAADARNEFAALRADAQKLANRARIWTIASGIVVVLVVLWTIRLFLKMERELVRYVKHEQRREMFQLLEQVPVGVYVVTANGKPYYANQQALQMLGDVEVSEASELTTAYKAYEIGTDRIYPTERAPIVRALSGERTEVSDMEIRREHDTIPLHVRGCPVVLDDKVAFAIAAFQDVRELRRIATRDALTGLPNRAAVSEAFARERLLAERGEYKLSLALIDFDHFKSVNDAYGHMAGDDVLVRGSAAIGGALRRTDLLARWGGEELVVLLPKADLGGAKLALEKALEAVRSLEMTAGERTFRVTFSAGVVELAIGETLESAIERADAALYTAKREGRDRIVCGTA